MQFVAVDTPAGGMEASPSPLSIFVAGDHSQVGKSSVCLALLASLLRRGFAPHELAYIKPATQCEAPQLVARFCASRGIRAVGVGPIVFYAGFTREFLAGDTVSSAALLSRAVEAHRAVAAGARVVVVDGVGYPSVGSICGVCNAAVARALGAPVLLVGRKGVGDAVDAYNLNASYFGSFGVPVLGGVFNRLPPPAASGGAVSFYSLDKCAAAVRRYFELYRPQQRAYGFLPELPEPAADAAGAAAAVAAGPAAGGPEPVLTAAEEARVEQLAAAFGAAVDVDLLLSDARAAVAALRSPSGFPPARAAAGAAGASELQEPPPPPSPPPPLPLPSAAGGDAAQRPAPRSRAEVEADALQAGAAVGA
jgi:dethiobiotin synthetase